MTVTDSDLLAMIDHSLLRADTTLADLEEFAAVCADRGFQGACVNSCYVARLVELLRGSGVCVVATVGFPLGACAPGVKQAEAEEACAKGAGEVDMVLNVGLLRSGAAGQVKSDIAGVVRACSTVPVKVILETCYLTDEEKRLGCTLAVEAGAGWVKTSTGFGAAGATPADVALMHQAAAGSGVRVKAAGGIRDVKTALAMVGAGARRLGVSAGDRLVDEFRQLYPHGCELPTGE